MSSGIRPGLPDPRQSRHSAKPWSGTDGFSGSLRRWESRWNTGPKLGWGGGCHCGGDTGQEAVVLRPKVLKHRIGAGRPHAHQTTGKRGGYCGCGRVSLGAPSPAAHRDSAAFTLRSRRVSFVESSAWSPVTPSWRPSCGFPHPRVADGPGTPGTRVCATEDGSRCWLRVWTDPGSHWRWSGEKPGSMVALLFV